MMPSRTFDRPQRYLIKVKGKLDSDWTHWFGEFNISCCEDESILSGWVADQAELFAILTKIRDLGLPLLLVHYVDSEGPNQVRDRKRGDL